MTRRFASTPDAATEWLGDATSVPRTAIACTTVALLCILFVAVGIFGYCLLDVFVQRLDALVAASAASITGKTGAEGRSAVAAQQKAEFETLMDAVRVAEKQSESLPAGIVELISSRDAADARAKAAEEAVGYFEKAFEELRDEVAQCSEALECSVRHRDATRLELEGAVKMLKEKDAVLADLEARNAALQKKGDDYESMQLLVKKMASEKTELMRRAAKEKDELERALYRKAQAELKGALEAFLIEGSGERTASLAAGPAAVFATNSSSESQ